MYRQEMMIKGLYQVDAHAHNPALHHQVPLLHLSCL